MKSIAILLFLSTAAFGAPDGPGKSALQFLEKVRTGELNLEPGGDTAISPQTSERKRQEISRRVETLASDLERSPLEIGPVKQQGNLAAVLVRNLGGFDPARIRVVPVALVRRGANWLAAPVPASFENSGIGYDAETRGNARNLEAWMLSQQVIEAETLRHNASNRMRENIETAMPLDELKSLSPAQLAEAFSDACLTGNVPRALAILQGRGKPLADDWALNLRNVENGLLHAAGHPVWRLLASPSVFRYVSPSKGGKRSVPVNLLFLDPAVDSSKDRPSFHVITLKLKKPTDGHWYLPFPSILRPEVEEDTTVNPSKHSELLQPLVQFLGNDIPSPNHSTAEAARDGLLQSLSSPTLDPLLAQVTFSKEPQTDLRLALNAARLWRDVHHPATLCHPVPLAFHPSPDTAAGLFLFFSPRTPDRLDLRILYFENRDENWRWQPMPPPETQNSFKDWNLAQTTKWRKQWQDTLLKDSSVLSAPTTAPDPNEAKAVVDTFLKALAKRDLSAALALTARLDTPKSPSTLLRNLGYELDSPQSHDGLTSFGLTLQGKHLTSILVHSQSAGATRKPVYTLAQTTDGPRILLECDLFLSEKRSRGFLNRTSLEHLSTALPEAAAELKQQLAQFAE